MRKLMSLALAVTTVIGMLGYAAPAFAAENYPLNSIVIKLEDIVTHSMLGGGRFEIFFSNDQESGGYGTLIHTLDTDGSGVIVLSGIASGYYIVRQTAPPNNYHLSINNEQHCYLKPDGTSIEELVFSNYRYGGIVVILSDSDTGQPIPGATFSVTAVTNAAVGPSADGNYTTDAAGEFFLENLEAGDYKITQLTAAAGYALNSAPNMRTIRLQHTSADQSVFRATFENSPLGSLIVRLKDSVSKEPLSGGVFNVKLSGGADLGEFETGAGGSFMLPKVGRGAYVVTQISAPAGYLMANTPKTQYVNYVQTFAVDFENSPRSGLYILKLDEETKTPLKDAKFTVYKASEVIGTYTTNADGAVVLPNLDPGWYTVSEYKAPDGYVLDDTPQSVLVTSEQLHKLTFEDKRLASLQIIKTDEHTGTPLSGAKFRVTTQAGAFVADVTTDNAGKASIPNIAPGWYVVAETDAPAGYLISEGARTVEVKATVPTVITVTNRAENNLELLKLDAFTRTPLSGATFKVERANGAGVGTYRTDSTGKVLVGSLKEDTYVISEVAAPEGYQLDSEPQVVVVEGGKLQTVEFLDKPLAGLKIIKLDSSTRQPLAGAEFAINRMDGGQVGAFRTDSAGAIFISGLEPGWYTVTEIKAADGYILDAEPQKVEIASGEAKTLEIVNTAQAGLVIVKTDAQTGRSLAGAVFDVTRADGQRATGSILDGNQPNTSANSPDRTGSGSYITDASGRLQINGLPAGEYQVIERKAPEGYELDAEVHLVTVTPGTVNTLNLTNTRLAGLRLLKLDSVTRQPIYNAEFMLFDKNKNVVGTYYTDNNGVIDFTGVLEAGRYTLRETRPAPGYYADDTPRTLEFKSGRVTEVVWENTPQAGQIQIMKKSGDDNTVNGLPAGSPLAGAVFEVYAYKSGNLIDRFVSGADGRAVSKPLPLGRYTLKEVQAPQWYRAGTETLDVEIEFATQIVKLEYLNFAANTGVTIRKVGNYETMSGDTIRYDLKELKNTSTVPLTDFYWRDTLPIDAARLSHIVTGSYSQALMYKVTAMTSKGNSLVIADNLSTARNNYIDCAPVALGLASEEYITSVTFLFGTVRAGFSAVQSPQVYVTVLPYLPNGYQFANKADVGGKYLTEWVVGNSAWRTSVYAQYKPLPRTGY